MLSYAALAFHVTENAWVHASPADLRPIRLLPKPVEIKPKKKARKSRAKAA